jgi:hypothetical protein
MEQRLMLRRDLGRRGDRRHRLDAFAGNWHQQPQAVVAHWLSSMRVAQHRAEGLDIGRQSRFSVPAAGQ